MTMWFCRHEDANNRLSVASYVVLIADAAGGDWGKYTDMLKKYTDLT